MAHLWFISVKSCQLKAVQGVKMGTFAATANLNYRLLFAGQGKQTSIFVCRKQMEVCHFVFRLQQTNGSCCFPLVPFFHVYI
jgi:hypothetical protein